MIDDDPDFAELLKGKRVAVVGPARTLVGSGRGALIDSFDIVVRFNDAFEYLSGGEIANDVGRRADVMYCNPVILRRQVLGASRAAQLRFLAACRQIGVRYFVCTNNSLIYGRTGRPRASCDACDRSTTAAFDDLLHRHALPPRFRVVHAASALAAKWLEGHWGRTGFIGLLDVLTFEPRAVFVTGMTLYHGGGHLLAPADRTLHPRGNRDGTPAQGADGRGHDSNLERDRLAVLARCFRQSLELDADLQQLLLHYDADLDERSSTHRILRVERRSADR